MADNITISFGVLAPRISEQLDNLKYIYKTESIRAIQRDVDAINRLSVRGVLPDSVVTSARKMLLKRIIAEIL